MLPEASWPALVLMLGALLATGLIYARIRSSMLERRILLIDGFVLGLWIYTIGALVEAPSSPQYGRGILFIATAVALAGTIAGCIAARAFSTNKQSLIGGFHRSLGTVRRAIGPVMGFVMAGSAGIVVVALLLVGADFVAAVRAFFSGDAGAVLDYRVAITQGTSGYLAPGYVKQFRDFLLPATSMALLFATSPSHRLVGWLGIGLSMVGVLATGQRGPMVVLFLGLGYILWTRGSIRQVNRMRRISAFAAVAFFTTVGFLSTTILLGRAPQDRSGASLDVVFGDGLRRVFTDVPRQNMAAASVWSSGAPTWGSSWIADLRGILPGTQHSLAQQLHGELFGSMRGNSPLGMPADLWLAWGFPGVVLLPFVFAFGLYALDGWFRRRMSPVKESARILLLVSLPWVYSPFLFMLHGGIVCIFVGLVDDFLDRGSALVRRTTPSIVRDKLESAHRKDGRPAMGTNTLGEHHP